MDRPFTADSLWTYENGVLKNKFGIKNMNELNLKEKEIINKKTPNIKLDKFDMEEFINLHKFLFEDLYDFAGILRNENIIDYGVMLCKYTVIKLCLTDLFKSFNKVKINSSLKLCEFLAYYYSELCIIAPFRDGNDIVIKKFLELFCKSLGYDFSFENINEKDLKEATIYAFYNDTSKLINIFKKAF